MEQTEYTVAEATKELNVSRRTIYRWIKDGTCKAVKSPKRYNISAKELKKLRGRR